MRRSVLAWCCAVVWVAGVSVCGVAESTDGDDVTALLAEAEELRAAGEAHRSMEVYRQVLRLRPDHEAAYDRLVDLAATTPLAASPQRMKALAEQFPSGTHLRRTEHYLIVYDGSHVAANGRAVLLEKAHDAFYETLRAAGWKPLPLRERLVCILFSRHADYSAYASETDGLDTTDTGGYYSSRTNRITLFNNRTSPRRREANERISQLQSAIDRVTEQIADAGRAGDVNRLQHLRNRRSQAIRERARIAGRDEAGAGLTNIMQTLHEAAHQLAYNSGVHSRVRRQPIWVAEGLATNFEATHPAVPFGPASDNRPRRRALVQAYRRGELKPLGPFVSMMEMVGADSEDRGVLYAQSWGLFHFLFTERLPQLRRYMLSLRDDPIVGESATERGIDRFEAAFGPVGEVEADWRRFVSGLE